MFTGFYLVLLGFTGFSFDFTGFYLVLLGFYWFVTGFLPSFVVYFFSRHLKWCYGVWTECCFCFFFLFSVTKRSESHPGRESDPQQPTVVASLAPAGPFIQFRFVCCSLIRRRVLQIGRFDPTMTTGLSIPFFAFSALSPAGVLCTEFYWVSPIIYHFTELYRVCVWLNRFFWLLPSFTGLMVGMNGLLYGFT